jgi:hypothetical protein
MKCKGTKGQLLEFSEDIRNDPIAFGATHWDQKQISPFRGAVSWRVVAALFLRTRIVVSLSLTTICFAAFAANTAVRNKLMFLGD